MKKVVKITVVGLVALMFAFSFAACDFLFDNNGNNGNTPVLPPLSVARQALERAGFEIEEYSEEILIQNTGNLAGWAESVGIVWGGEMVRGFNATCEDRSEVVGIAEFDTVASAQQYIEVIRESVRQWEGYTAPENMRRIGAIIYVGDAAAVEIVRGAIGGNLVSFN